MSSPNPSPLNYEHTLQRAIGDIDVPAAKIQVCVAALTKNAKAPSFEKLEISTGLASDFRAIVEDVFDDLRRDLNRQRLRIHQHEAGAQLQDHELEHLDLSNHQDIRKQIDALTRPLNMDTFTERREIYTELRFYVIIVEPHDGSPPIYCFRFMGARNRLGRTLFAAIRGRGDGYFDSPRADTAFLFDRKVDCIVRGDDMFIKNKDKFQRMFYFYQYVRNSAERVLDVLRKKGLICNFDDFAQACLDDLRYLTKVARMADKPHLQRLNVRSMKRVRNRHSLRVRIEPCGGHERLVYEPDSMWELLHLLSDDYLGSRMTGLDYRAPGKHSI